MPNRPTHISDPLSRSGRHPWVKWTACVVALVCVAIVITWNRYQAYEASREPLILGNTTVERWMFERMALDSVAGRDWRKRNRRKLLALAKKSLGPKTYEQPKVSPGEIQFLGALESVARVSTPHLDERWMVPNHLEWLFIDHQQELENRDADDQKSLAMEFWPTFDAMLDDIPQFRDHTRDKLRWNYLARLWPESTQDMFIGSYMAMDIISRQNLLTGFPAGTVPYRSPLPDVIPAETKLEILRRIRHRVQEERVDADVKTYRWIDVFDPFLYEPELEATELAVIDWAIASVDHPSVIDDWMKLTEADFGKEPANRSMPFPHPKVFTLPHNAGFDRHVLELAKHRNPEFQRIAIDAVQKFPSPNRLIALDAIIANGHADLRARAKQLKRELNESASVAVPHVD